MRKHILCWLGTKLVITGGILGVGLLGCTELQEDPVGALGEGDACSQVSECEAGLDCISDVCTPIDSSPTGVKRGDCCDAALYAATDPAGTCGTPADCSEADLVCGTQGVCTTFAGNDRGEPCGLTVDCKQTPVALVCHGNDGICVDPDDDPNPGCAPPLDCEFGIKDLGDPCVELTECQRPFICSLASFQCEKLPFYPGPDCFRTETEAGLFRVYYEIPPDQIVAGEPFEFYRLPFPNDIRFEDGHMRLDGHASPGEIFGIDVTGTILGSIEEDADGFAINSPVFFRFTDPPTLESICLDPGSIYSDPVPLADGTIPGEYCPGHDGSDPPAATVYLVNIDLDSDDYNQRIPVQLSFGRDRGQYNCQNMLGIGPLDGHPLEHSTTYAAVITTGDPETTVNVVRDVRGAPPIQDADFVKILEADPTLSAHVLAATEPLRAWLAAQGIDPDTIAAAAVFTTRNPDALTPELRAAVYTRPEPVFEADAFECINCGSLGQTACEAASGCEWSGGACVDFSFACHRMPLLDPSSPPRGCAGTWSDFYEIHGTYDAPVFQDGVRPYLTADFGGALDLSQTHGSAEEMCYALAVPKTPMPPGGWPVIIYAHGTGGNYRSFIATQAEFTRMLVGLGFMVIGFDNVMHGPRQDPLRNQHQWSPGYWRDPSNLFFNVVNARAARDNVLQGSIDLFHLTRLLVAEGNRAVPTLSVSGVDTEIDPDEIYFFGHSQGTTIVYPYLVEETNLKAAVLSGAGAELALSVLNKKKPVDISEVAGMLFADRGLTRIHPMMGILVQLFGPSDAIAYAPHLPLGRPASDPLGAGRGPLPLLITYGIGDSYSPDVVQDALMTSMGIDLITAGPPVTDNHCAAGGSPCVTAGYVKLDPDTVGASDGHFVAFSSEGREIIRTFLDTAMYGGTAEIDR